MAEISFRPTKEMEKKIEELCRIKHMEKHSLIKRLVDIGLREELKEYALELFTKKKVSLGKAAEIADISLREMHDLIKERGIPLHISSEDIQKDFKAVTE